MTHSHRQHEDFFALLRALDAGPTESMSQAALRVFKQNCAPKPALRAARILLEIAPGAPAHEQWRVIHRAAHAYRAAQSN